MRFSLLFATLFALPVFVDVHDTNVAILETEKTKSNSEFLVQVTRQDALLDDDILKATKTQVVLFKVNVENDQVLVNNQPVEMGYSVVQLEATTLIGTADDFTLEDAMEHLEQGVVQVEFEVSGQNIEKDGVIVRQIELSERVLSINGDVVNQEKQSQIVFEAFVDEKKSPCHYRPKKVVACAIFGVSAVFLSFLSWVFFCSSQKKSVYEPVKESLPLYEESEKVPAYSK
jgi:hypothetical protein